MNENIEIIANSLNKRPLAYKIGDKLPKVLRVIYYILLSITLIYWGFRLIVFTFKSVQKIGAFLFEKEHYNTFIFCLFVLAIGTLIISQFVLNLDPFGKAVQWFIEKWNEFENWFINLFK